MLLPGDWVSEHHHEYHVHPLDIKGNYEQAQAVHKMFTGPTASVGKVSTWG